MKACMCCRAGDHGPGTGSEAERKRGGVFGRGGEAETGVDDDGAAALEPITHLCVGRNGK